MTSSELSDARQRLIADCMQKHGLEYTPVFLPPDEPLTRSEARAYRERHGFGDSISSGTDDALAANAERFDAMDSVELDRYLSVLEGEDRSEDASPGGCAGAAEQQLSGEAPILRNDDQTLSEIGNRYRTVYDAPEMRGALAGYARCVSEAGMDVERPDEAPQAALAVARDAQESVRLALADWDCQAAWVWPVLDELYPLPI